MGHTCGTWAWLAGHESCGMDAQSRVLVPSTDHWLVLLAGSVLADRRTLDSLQAPTTAMLLPALAATVQQIY